MRKQSAWDYLLALLVPASVIAFHSAFISDMTVFIMTLLNAAAIIVLIPWGTANIMVTTLNASFKNQLTGKEFFKHASALYSYGIMDDLISKAISSALIAFALFKVYKIRGGKIEAGYVKRFGWKLDCILLLLNPSAATARHSKSRMRMIVTDLLEIFSIASLMVLITRIMASSWMKILRDNFPDRYSSINQGQIIKVLNITAAILIIIAPAPLLLALSTIRKSNRQSQMGFNESEKDFNMSA